MDTYTVYALWEGEIIDTYTDFDATDYYSAYEGFHRFATEFMDSRDDVSVNIAQGDQIVDSLHIPGSDRFI